MKLTKEEFNLLEDSDKWNLFNHMQEMFFSSQKSIDGALNSLKRLL